MAGISSSESIAITLMKRQMTAVTDSNIVVNSRLNLVDHADSPRNNSNPHSTKSIARAQVHENVENQLQPSSELQNDKQVFRERVITSDFSSALNHLQAASHAIAFCHAATHANEKKTQAHQSSSNNNNSEGEKPITTHSQALIEILKKEVRKQREIQQIDEAVCELKFFRDRKEQLSEKLYLKLLEKLKYQHLPKEQALFHLGDKGDKFYIVLRGQCVLLLPPKHYENGVNPENQGTISQNILRLKERYLRIKELEIEHEKAQLNSERSLTTNSPHMTVGTPVAAGGIKQSSSSNQIIFAKKLAQIITKKRLDSPSGSQRKIVFNTSQNNISSSNNNLNNNNSNVSVNSNNISIMNTPKASNFQQHGFGGFAAVSTFATKVSDEQSLNLKLKQLQEQQLLLQQQYQDQQIQQQQSHKQHKQFQQSSQQQQMSQPQHQLASQSSQLFINLESAGYLQEQQDSVFDLYCEAFHPKLKQTFVFEEGMGFGEIALLRKTERAGTVVSRVASDLMCLEREDFEEILGRQERQKTEDALCFLQTFAFFKHVTEKVLMGLVHQTKILHIQRNEFVYKPGDPADALCLIRSGEIEFSQPKSIGSHVHSKKFVGEESSSGAAVASGSVTSRRDELVRFALLSTNGSFGSEDILLDIPCRQHYARVSSNSAQIWVVNKEQFMTLLKSQQSFEYFQEIAQQHKDLRESRLNRITQIIDLKNSSSNSNVPQQSSIQSIENKKLFLPSTSSSSLGIATRSSSIPNTQRQLLLESSAAKKHNFFVNASIQLPASNSQSTLADENHSKQSNEDAAAAFTNGRNVKKQNISNADNNINNKSTSKNINLNNSSSTSSLKHRKKLVTVLSSQQLNSVIYGDSSTTLLQSQNNKLSTNHTHECHDNNLAYPIESEDQRQHEAQLVEALFPRSTYISTLKSENQAKKQIMKSIQSTSQKLHAALNSSSVHESDGSGGINDNNNNHSSSEKNLLPFSKNLLFQPKVGNGVRKEIFRDPFKPEETNDHHHHMRKNNALLSSKRGSLDKSAATHANNEGIKTDLTIPFMQSARDGSSSYKTRPSIVSPKSLMILQQTLNQFESRRASIEELGISLFSPRLSHISKSIGNFQSSSSVQQETTTMLLSSSQQQLSQLTERNLSRGTGSTRTSLMNLLGSAATNSSGSGSLGNASSSITSPVSPSMKIHSVKRPVLSSFACATNHDFDRMQSKFANQAAIATTPKAAGESNPIMSFYQQQQQSQQHSHRFMQGGKSSMECSLELISSNRQMENKMSESAQKLDESAIPSSLSSTPKNAKGNRRSSIKVLFGAKKYVQQQSDEANNDYSTQSPEQQQQQDKEPIQKTHKISLLLPGNSTGKRVKTEGSSGSSNLDEYVSSVYGIMSTANTFESDVTSVKIKPAQLYQLHQQEQQQQQLLSSSSQMQHTLGDETRGFSFLNQLSSNRKRSVGGGGVVVPFVAISQPTMTTTHQIESVSPKASMNIHMDRMRSLNALKNSKNHQHHHLKMDTSQKSKRETGTAQLSQATQNQVKATAINLDQQAVFTSPRGQHTNANSIQLRDRTHFN